MPLADPQMTVPGRDGGPVEVETRHAVLLSSTALRTAFVEPFPPGGPQSWCRDRHSPLPSSRASVRLEPHTWLAWSGGIESVQGRRLHRILVKPRAPAGAMLSNAGSLLLSEGGKVHRLATVLRLLRKGLNFHIHRSPSAHILD